MKRIIRTLIIASLAFSVVPTFANNWQWQFDQINSDQQRRAKCVAAEQAKLNPTRSEGPRPKAIESDRKLTSSPSAK